jgi:hypothetical protein
MRIHTFTCLVVASLATSAARAENYGDIFARCYAETNRKLGDASETLWKRCEEYAQRVKDGEAKPEAPVKTVGPNMRLFKPALAVYQCTQEKTKTLLNSVPKSRFTDGSQAEAFVWSQVLDSCSKELTNVESKSMLFQNFAGDRQRMIDFGDGILWSARAQVLTSVMDWYPKR